jgi:hypothetical protein
MKKPTTASLSSFDVRQTYLKHEAAIMMVGQLYYFIGMGLTLCAVTGVLMKSFGAALPWSGTLGVAGVIVVLGALYALVGYGLRSLYVWSRYAAAFLALLCLASLRVNSQVQGYAATTLNLVGMFAMPIGIVLTGYAAYLALSPKGAVVFSRDYRRVIEATPEIQYTFAKVFMVTGVLLVAVQSFMLVPVFGVGR